MLTAWKKTQKWLCKVHAQCSVLKKIEYYETNVRARCADSKHILPLLEVVHQSDLQFLKSNFSKQHKLLINQ